MDVYASEALSGLKNLNTFAAEFKEYKLNGNLSQNIGRDAPIDDSPAARTSELQHMHLAEIGSLFRIRQDQYHRTSDRILVYCQGIINPDVYILLVILEPNGHKRLRTSEIQGVADLAERLRKVYDK